MAAFNQKAVEQQIANAKDLANVISRAQTAIYQYLEAKEAVNQAWGQLHNDFPDMVLTPEGQTPAQTNPILLNGVEQQFSPQYLNQFDNAVTDLASALDGVDITVTTNLGRNIRRLTTGTV